MLWILLALPPKNLEFEPIPDKPTWVTLPNVASKLLPPRLISSKSTIELPDGPMPENAINFLITNKQPVGSPKPRDLCAVEAAARVHPDKVVALSIASDMLDNNKLIRGLANAYPNIAFLKFDILKLLNDTVLFDWYNTSGVKSSKYLYVHDSDLGRMAILQKYGGYYLDNDVLTIQRFSNIRNAIALDHIDLYVNNNFLHFEKGHPFLSDYMDYISTM